MLLTSQNSRKKLLEKNNKKLHITNLGTWSLGLHHSNTQCGISYTK